LSGKNCSPEKTARRAHSETTTQAKKLQKRVSQRITTNASPREQVTRDPHGNVLDRMDRVWLPTNTTRIETQQRNTGEDRFYWLDERKLKKNVQQERICARYVVIITMETTTLKYCLASTSFILNVCASMSVPTTTRRVRYVGWKFQAKKQNDKLSTTGSKVMQINPYKDITYNESSPHRSSSVNSRDE
jgi:hypothetical protein